MLIPAALENVITAENADAVKAPVIVEVANGPTTSDGRRDPDDAGKLVVPDILANAGGVTVSYFEWVQNKQGYYWTEPGAREARRRSCPGSSTRSINSPTGTASTCGQRRMSMP